jgi:hypothetical protein
MPRFDPELLRQEVDELTALLRDGEHWADVRTALASKGLPANRVVLTGFMEDEDENEFGVVITDELEVFQYQRDTSSNPRHFITWCKVDNPAQLLDTFPAVEFGLELARRLYG